MDARAKAIATRLVDRIDFGRSRSAGVDQDASPKTEPSKNSKPSQSAECIETQAWSPLASDDAIRILRLDAAEDHDAVVQGCLFACRLSHPPSYEAISYNWGERAQPCSLELICGRTLAITTNLDSALRSFRLKDRTRLLWVDAICIDQGSLDEKAKQVAMMASIFKMALQVLCWLGPAIEKTSGAIDFLDCQATAATSLGLEDLGRYMPQRLEIISIKATKKTALEIFEDADGHSVGEIYARKYFSRLWICQEAALSRKAIICIGPHQIDWDRFVAGTMVVLGASKLLGSRKGSLSFVAQAWSVMSLRVKVRFLALPGVFSTSPYAEFGSHLRSILHHDCEDDRDRIYALMGLKPADCDIDIMPDYRKHVTEVYTDFARQFLMYDVYSLLDAGLCRRQNVQDRILDGQDMFGSGHLPSWVPDYRLSRSGLTSFPWDHNKFSAATDIPTSATSSPDEPCRIHVRGFVLDVVESIAGFDNKGTGVDELSYSQTAGFTAAWLEILARTSQARGLTSAASGGPLIPKSYVEAFASALLLDQTCDELQALLPSSPKILSVQFLQFYLKHFVTTDELPAEVPHHVADASKPGYPQTKPSRADAELRIAREYHQCLSILLGKYQLRFIMTKEEGLFGWTPNVTKEKDIIVILDGAPTPFVLRPISTLKILPDGRHEAQHTYELVGPCYIEGVMHGELTRADIPDDSWKMLPID